MSFKPNVFALPALDWVVVAMARCPRPHRKLPYEHTVLLAPLQTIERVSSVLRADVGVEVLQQTIAEWVQVDLRDIAAHGAIHSTVPVRRRFKTDAWASAVLDRPDGAGFLADLELPSILQLGQDVSPRAQGGATLKAAAVDKMIKR